jgi:hypothetical protein
MQKPLVWPVYGFGDGYFRKEPVATFFSWGEAADYAMRPVERDGWEPRSLYVAQPRRKGGSYDANL